MENGTLQIQVLGSGCATCKRLFELTKRAVKELQMRAEVEYVTDIQKIVDMGVMASPILAVNGKPVMTGPISDIDQIKEAISGTASSGPDSGTCRGCKCGGNC